MIFLRCLAALAGILILLFAPQVAPEFADIVGARNVPNGKIMVLAMAGGALLAAGFFFAAMVGPSLMRRPGMRAIAAILIALPFGASAWALAASDQMPLLSVAAPLLAFSAIVFSAFVWPGATRPKRRYTRLPEGYVAPGSGK
ncbi:MAG: hypothetical protein ACXW2U_03630 [Telluria sp.]